MSAGHIRKPPFWASFFTLLAFIILCGLGTWQLIRLEWKTGLLREMEKSYAAPVKTDSSYQDLLQASPYERVRVQGSYLPEYQIMVGPRPYQGEAGFHVVIPFAIRNAKMDEEGYILVNRGWSPDKNYTTPYNRDVAVTGMLRDPARLLNPFGPDNVPTENQWFDIDLAQVQKETGLNPLVPYVLYADRENPDDKRLDKKPLRWAPPNNHLSYAVFWFATAATLLVIFFFRFISPAQKEILAEKVNPPASTKNTGKKGSAHDER